MPSNLIHQLNGTVPASRSQRLSRQGTALARHLVEEVQIAGLQTDGALALAAHAMEGIVALDEHRRGLAKDDVVLDSILSSIEATAIRQVQRVQAGLHRDQCLGL